ncbi:MAG: hypothetical protein HY914_22460 [Desulfomonile tiedjei]|nr:hypothetical protein [Desulfomonile tiedjei]
MTDLNGKNREAPVQGLSWSTHYLLTRIALQTCSDSSLDNAIPVTPLEDFLSRSHNALRDPIRWYWGLLERKGGPTASVHAGPGAITTQQDFLTALRLNPEVSIPYVRCITPEEAPPDAPYDPSRSGPPHGSYQETAEGEAVKVSEIVSVFSDEPDWGMDQDLFRAESYGYGPIPFGTPTGHSSQACFHMAFLHEPPLLTAVLPRLKKSFLEERVRVFLALAGVAFDERADYWGWRFTAWAIHYLQDVTQPYHARALPFPLWRILLRLLAHPVPKRFAEKNGNVLMNRHYLFEALVHLIFNTAVKRRDDHAFMTALKMAGESYRGPLAAVIDRASAIAATRALRVNALLELILNDPRINRSDYVASNDPSYPLAEKLAQVSADQPAMVREFVELVAECLAQAGMVSRYVVERTGTAPRRPDSKGLSTR